MLLQSSSLPSSDCVNRCDGLFHFIVAETMTCAGYSVRTYSVWMGIRWQIIFFKKTILEAIIFPLSRKLSSNLAPRGLATKQKALAREIAPEVYRMGAYCRGVLETEKPLKLAEKWKIARNFIANRKPKQHPLLTKLGFKGRLQNLPLCYLIFLRQNLFYFPKLFLRIPSLMQNSSLRSERSELTAT